MKDTAEQDLGELLYYMYDRYGTPARWKTLPDNLKQNWFDDSQCILAFFKEVLTSE